MHLALASNVDDASFAPVPYSTLDRRSNYQSVRNLVGKTLRLLRECLRPDLPAASPTTRAGWSAARSRC